MQKLILAIVDLLVTLLLSVTFQILFVIAVIIVILVLIYRACKLRALERMEYIRSFSSGGVFEGEYFELKETIRNTTLCPLFFVRMEFFVPTGFTVDDIVCKTHTKVTSLFHVPPFASATQTHTFRADKRGHYQLINSSIIYRKNEFTFSHPFDIYVYPNHNDISVDTATDLYHAGNSIAGRKYLEDPFFLSDIRPYQYGDPMRAINFKASARSFSGGAVHLMSNSYDTSRNFDSMIFLDPYLRSEHGRAVDDAALLELGLSCACKLLMETVKNSGRVGFASNCAVGSKIGVNIHCDVGEAHTRAILECMAQMSAYASRDFSLSHMLLESASRLERGTDIYLITPHIDAGTSEAIHKLERMGQNVYVIPISERRDEREANKEILA
jgi:uncharacterized protein (DUF58 family)